MTLRLFIAMACPATPQVRHILRLINDLQPIAKPVPLEQLHFTLRFLGDMQPAHLPALRQAIDRAAGARPRPLAVNFVRLGRFPVDPAKAMRVVYADPAEPGELMALADELDAQLSDTLGAALPERDRAFRAHLTLARVKPTRPTRRSRVSIPPREHPYTQLRQLVEAHGKADLGRAMVNSVHLYASTLTPTGPRYESLHCARMDAAAASRAGG